MVRMRSALSARRQIIAYIVIACASFLVLMTAACMVLDPGLFDHPHWGLSYYGSQRVTVLPYYVGYIIVLACLAQITRLLWRLNNRWRRLRMVFLVSAALTFLVAATSYMDWSTFVWWAHIYVCLALLLWVFGSEVWVMARPGRTLLDYAALILLICGMVLIFLTSEWVGGGVLNGYYWAEVVLFLGAFACLGRAALRAIESN